MVHALRFVIPCISRLVLGVLFVSPAGLSLCISVLLLPVCNSEPCAWVVNFVARGVEFLFRLALDVQMFDDLIRRLYLVLRIRPNVAMIV